MQFKELKRKEEIENLIEDFKNNNEKTIELLKENIKTAKKINQKENKKYSKILKKVLTK